MKISIIGAGAMGGAMATGLLASDSDYEITISNPSETPLRRLESLGVKVTHDNVECIRDAEIIVLAVKPWIVGTVIDEIKPFIDYERQTLVVIAASVSSRELVDMLSVNGAMPPVFLAMPNTAMSVSRSMTFLVAVSERCSPHITDTVNSIFDRLGSSMLIDEAHLPAATALASCGIAFAMRYVRAAVEGGVELGFKARQAQEIVVKTLEGTCALLNIQGAHPESEIDKVTTPGGITIKGLNEMEEAGFSAAVIRGLRATVF